MALWRLYYHLIWATKERHPLILPEQEPPLYNYIIAKSDEFKTIVHEVNGMSEHLHLIVSIPPTIPISEYVRKIKGSSSNYLNKLSANSFSWQRGYGIYSVGVKNLDIAINYVKNQKEHHAKGTIINALEIEKNDDDQPTKLYKKL